MLLLPHKSFQLSAISNQVSGSWLLATVAQNSSNSSNSHASMWFFCIPAVISRRLCRGEGCGGRVFPCSLPMLIVFDC
jgi:hypothetical protein